LVLIKRFQQVLSNGHSSQDQHGSTYGNFVDATNDVTLLNLDGGAENDEHENTGHEIAWKNDTG